MVRKIQKDWLLKLFPGTMATLIALVVLATSPAHSWGQAKQLSFSSPQQAVAALVAAVQDTTDAQLVAVLGRDSEDLISSGDKIADLNSKARFLKAYGEKNRLEQTDEARVRLLVGSKDYPFPFPIVRQGDAWLFATQEGREEILNRRIGRNELHTMAVMHAYTDAQREYACLSRNGDGQEFAQKFASSEGRKDGLYWQAAEGEEESPFGPLIAKAAQEGYVGGVHEDAAEPFHGYYFKILKAQGEHATGGAFDYVADGKMVLGFGLLAYPAKYGASGIMTFMVNQEGVIYEKDLGEETAIAAPALTVFDPDKNWHKSEEPAEQEGK